MLLLTAHYGCSNTKNEQQTNTVSKDIDTTSYTKQKEQDANSLQEKNDDNKCTSAPGSVNDSIFLSFNCLRIGLPFDSVLFYFGTPDNESEFVIGGIDGEFKKNITYSSQGITVDISTLDTIKTKPTVNSFVLKQPCNFVTAGNVGIGTSVENVKTALSGIIRKETEKRIFVGNIYYGTVFFVENDMVKKVFVGQLAE